MVCALFRAERFSEKRVKEKEGGGGGMCVMASLCHANRLLLRKSRKKKGKVFNDCHKRRAK